MMMNLYYYDKIKPDKSFVLTYLSAKILEFTLG